MPRGDAPRTRPGYPPASEPSAFPRSITCGQKLYPHFGNHNTRHVVGHDVPFHDEHGVPVWTFWRYVPLWHARRSEPVPPNRGTRQMRLRRVPMGLLLPVLMVCGQQDEAPRYEVVRGCRSQLVAIIPTSLMERYLDTRSWSC